MRRYTVRDWTTCLHCGKRGWPTRRAARQAARGRYADLSAYQCRHGGDLWHLGHLPPVVARGHSPREQVQHTRITPTRETTRKRNPT